MTELRRKRRDAGLCTECGVPAREGKTTCTGCAERKAAADRRRAEARGLWGGRRGRKPKYEYVAWRGNLIVARGTSREIAERFDMTQNEVCNYARVGSRRQKAGVFIEREVVG